jgi:Fis family transcriptional regulator
MDKNFSDRRTMEALAETGTYPLRDVITEIMQHYFANLKGEEPKNVYDFFLEEIEEPLLQVVMKFVRYNQSEAARILGVSRGTLRTMLKKFDMIDANDIDPEDDQEA